MLRLLCWPDIKCGNLYLGDKVANTGVLQILQFLQQLTPEALQRIGEIAVDDKQDVKLQLSGSFPVRLGQGAGGITEGFCVYDCVQRD